MKVNERDGGEWGELGTVHGEKEAQEFLNDEPSKTLLGHRDEEAWGEETAHAATGDYQSAHGACETQRANVDGRSVDRVMGKNDALSSVVASRGEGDSYFGSACRPLAHVLYPCRFSKAEGVEACGLCASGHLPAPS